MRNIPTEHPELVFKPNHTSIAAYCAMMNYIEFNSPYIDENDIECILIHELCHWAQYMFLDEEDVVCLAYPKPDYDDDITERMAYYISGEPQKSHTDRLKIRTKMRRKICQKLKSIYRKDYSKTVHWPS